MNVEELHQKYGIDPLADIPEPNDAECVICNEAIDLMNETNLDDKTCGCKYSFHIACITKWFEIGKHECVMCHTFMSKIKNVDIVQLEQTKYNKIIQLDYNIDVTTSMLKIDYIYLDASERRRFAHIGHNYLIDSVGNFTGNTDSDYVEEEPSNSVMEMPIYFY